MTSEQALKMAKAKLECIERETSGKTELCNNDCESCSLCYEQGNMGEQKEWLKMAIETLEQKQEPCDDCVSRKAVLDIIRFEDKWLTDAKSNNADTDIAFSGIKSKVTDLPPIQPKAKMGKWIPIYGNVKCSVCGNVKDSRNVGKATHYCDFCGAKMEVEK